MKFRAPPPISTVTALPSRSSKNLAAIPAEA
jgi:hypothetical protein